jgi:long-chain acyl-CoA synthetase
MAVGNLQSDTFPKLLLDHARQRGERPAIREKKRGIWRTTTWRVLADETAKLAAALSARGLKRGAHAALVGDNRPRLYAAMAATHALGAIAVPLFQDATADELAHALQQAEVTHVFAENQEQVDKLLGILPRCPAVRCIVYDDDRGMRHYRQPQLASYAALLQEGRDLAAASKGNVLEAEAARGSGEDAAFLFFTSGTGGPAKGVVLTHASLIDRARVVAATEGLTDADVAIAYLPPAWIGQTLFGYVHPMVVGYCVCCPESSESMLADMREIAPTYFLATPRVLEALFTQVTLRVQDAGGLNRGLYRGCMWLARRVGPRIVSRERVFVGSRLAYAIGNLLIYGPLRDVLGMSRVRVAYTAGDVIAPALLMYFRSLGINLKQLYGSTETGFMIAMQRNEEVKPDTVGRAAEGVELKFTPEREILVRSPGLFKEYHRDPGTTTQARNAEGWFHTGDAGYLGEDGHLRVIGRTKYVVALNDGTPYVPKIIESRLKFLPYIKEAVAFGDGRDKVCVLVDIDVAAVGRWADRHNIPYSGHADLASRDEVYELVGECVAEVNSELARDPTPVKTQIHRFLILQKELHADDGVLTRTGKLRRGVVAERYRPLVDAMYQGLADVALATEAAAGAETMSLKIRDARISAPAQDKRAVGR